MKTNIKRGVKTQSAEAKENLKGLKEGNQLETERVQRACLFPIVCEHDRVANLPSCTADRSRANIPVAVCNMNLLHQVVCCVLVLCERR